MARMSADEFAEETRRELEISLAEERAAARVAAAPLLAAIDGLRERELLDRVQVVTCGGASIQLGPPPLTFRPSHPANEQQPDPEDPLYAASEGYRS